MEDKMVELTRFAQASEAEMLVNLLRSEGIECYARDSLIGEIYRGIDLGGVKVELLEKDMQRAQEIMKDYGYSDSEKLSDLQNSEEPENVEESDNAEEFEIDDVSEYYITEYKRNKEKLSRTMLIGCIVVILALVGLILLNKYFERI